MANRRNNPADQNTNQDFPQESIRKGYNTDKQTDEKGGVNTYEQFGEMAHDTSDRTMKGVKTQPSLGRQVRSQGPQRGFTPMPPTDPDVD